MKKGVVEKEGEKWGFIVANDPKAIELEAPGLMSEKSRRVLVAPPVANLFMQDPYLRLRWVDIDGSIGFALPISTWVERFPDTARVFKRW